ncbi:MAG: SCP2 sterol-binding domain-containing protein [Oscillospiraceae bacterium]|nr:SCP2 sterol-binding domain-containing protein [Oscillospiraceae bacterium]
MTNIELAEKITGYLKGSKAKAKKYEDLVAVNFTFIDDMDDLYVEVREGVLTVAPYHYDDLQANVTGAAENIEKLFSGEVSFDKAVADGLVKVDGDAAKFKALEPLVPAKKAAPAAKAEAAKPAAPAAKTEAAKPAAPAAKPAVNAKKPAKKNKK